MRILVAEDNEFNSQLLEQLLTRRGYHVTVAINGRQALRLAEDGAFDLMLLDIHMPELDGFQVIETIRERERFAGGHLPVIALTARSRKEDRERCLAAGMDDFLSKPIQVVDLWSSIDRISQDGKGGTTVDEKQGAAASDSSVSRHPCANLIDPQAVLAACGGDGAILETICQVFRSHLPDHLTSIQTALQNQDASRLREAAHKLAGMVSAFSTAAGVVATHLEDDAANERLSDCKPLVEQLVTMSMELIHQVNGLSIENLRDQVVVAHK